MKNFIQPGHTLTAVAPAGGVASGSVQVVGDFIGVAATAALEGAEYELHMGHVFELPKAAGQVWAMGDELFYDDGTDTVTTTATDNTKIGHAAQSAASEAGLGHVRLRNDF